MSKSAGKGKEQRWRVKYKVDIETRPEGFTRDELEADKAGGADAVLICSFVKPPDGSLSFGIYGRDGETGGQVSQVDVFKACSLLAASLQYDPTLHEWQRQACRDFFAAVARVVTKRDT